MIHAILLTHGPIGEALIEAVRGIMGLDEGLHSLKVNDMSVAEISARLLSLVNAPEEKQDGVLIMASLKGGSCWNVAVTMAKDHPHARVVSGVNLSMLLSFLTKRELLDLDSLAETVVKDAIRGVTMYIKES
jgi:mannose/fructose-specific phosphotransferase system component IIA